MHFYVFGVNHKACPLEIREKLHFSGDELDKALGMARSCPEISELVILSTCNRVEFFVYASGSSAVRAFLLKLTEKIHRVSGESFAAFFEKLEGKAAIRHIFRVAAGLESLVVGESEILGQFRAVYQRAREHGTVSAMLGRLMEKALKTGKQVRESTRISRGAVSIPSAGVELARKIFGELKGQTVMVIGTGDMGVLTLKALKASGAEVRYVVSRDSASGEKIAMEFGAEWLAIETWGSHLEDIDILITATACPHILVSCDSLRGIVGKRRHRPIFMIDIAVPRNIEAAVNSLEDVYLYNVDDLKGVAAENLRQRRREIVHAERLVDRAVCDFSGWLEQLRVRPKLEKVEAFVSALIGQEFERLVKERHLDLSEKEKIKTRLCKRLMHPLREKIKEASKAGRAEKYIAAVEALWERGEG